MGTKLQDFLQRISSWLLLHQKKPKQLNKIYFVKELMSQIKNSNSNAELCSKVYEKKIVFWVFKPEFRKVC